MKCDNFIRIVIKDYIKPEYYNKTRNKTEEEKMKYLKEMGFEANPKGGYIFHCNTYARFFLRYTDVVLLPNEEELALYNQKKGVYELNAEAKLGKLTKYFMNTVYDLWNPSFETLALKTIRRDVKKIAMAFNTGDFINLKDGILDLNTFELYKHSPDYLSTVQLPFKYHSNNLTPVFKSILMILLVAITN